MTKQFLLFRLLLEVVNYIILICLHQIVQLDQVSTPSHTSRCLYWDRKYIFWDSLKVSECLFVSCFFFNNKYS